MGGDYIVYEHDGGESSSDELRYRATDGESYSKPEYINITIIAVNDEPEVVDIEVVVSEDASVELELEGSDIETESESLVYSIVSSANYGTLEQDNEIVVYSPSGNYNGLDEFSYVVDDGVSWCSSGSKYND